MFSQAQTIYINEFMASNSNTIADANGDFDDWVELYNPGNSAVDISNYFVSDDLSNQNKRQLPNNPAALTIPPGGYLLLWFDAEPLQGPNHVDLKLGASGEDIVLVANDGTTIVDSYTFGPQTADLSEGRTPNGGTNWSFYATPTPGASNGTPSGSDRAEKPIASIPGGLHNNTLTIALTSNTPGAEIRYTLDGSEPSETATLYTTPISISEITPLRAVAFSTGLLPSKIMTETYLVNIEHEFAIISLSIAPDYLFDPQIGIFENPTGENEHPANVEFYEPDGTLGFSQEVEVEIQGAATLTLGQKSLKFKAKASLGNEFINYPVFPDLPYDKYRSILIRQSGQDWKKSSFRDAMMQSLIGDLTDVGNIIEEPDMDVQGFRPSVVYINGEYWGIYNIREQLTWKYLDTHYGLDEEESYVAERVSSGVEGDEAPYYAFENFLNNNTFTSDVNYEALKEKLDIDHFVDYMMHGIYIDNNDWPGNNNKFWRPREENGKWRFFTKDLDFGFGLRPLNADWNSGDFTTDMIAVTLAENSSNYYNPPEATLMFRKFMENETARINFFNRASDLLNTLFETDRVVARIDAFEDLFTPEYQAHLDRWNGGWNQHAQEVETLRTFANGRGGAVRDHIVNYFSEVDGLTELNINANPQNGGTIHFSTLNLAAANFPFTGTYFTGINIPVRAKAERGFVLTSWSDAALGNAVSGFVNYSSAANNLIANFELGSTANVPIIINEINYNSPDFPNSGDWIELYNPNGEAVDVSGWYFEDESGNYFGLPANTILGADNYLLIVEDLEKFQAIYPSVQNVFGGFGDYADGFKLSNGGELITLKNANNELIDEVNYDDKSPWPTAPDGDGPTLQLSAPSLDNSIAPSWISYPPTPGALNGVTPAIQDQAIWFEEIPDQYTFAPAFNLAATATSGLDVSFSILSGPATISNNTITIDGIPGAVVVQATQMGNANYNAASPVQQTFLVTLFDDPAEGYCESEGSAPWQEWIANVTFGSINYDSGKDKYGDYTVQGTYVEQGESLPISITPGYSWQTYDNYFRVWIDYNQDGDFDDDGETVFSVFENSLDTKTGTVSIPSDANLGITRMRVSMKRDAYATPCELFERGEVEDYTVVIQESSGNNNGVLNIDCPENITLTATGGAMSMPVFWNEPSANTTCPLGGVSLSLVAGSIPNGGSFPIGTSTVNYQAADACDNNASCSFTVTVLENTGELTLDCPATIETNTEPGADFAIVNYPLPTANTTCALGGVNVLLAANSIPSGGSFPIGATFVNFVATDACGNTASCFLTVKVNDTPVDFMVECPSGITIDLPAGTNSQATTWSEPAASTDCYSGGLMISQIAGPDNGSELSPGFYEVIYEVTDNCGSAFLCDFNITVTGTTTSDLTLECSNNLSFIIPANESSIEVNWDLPFASSSCQSGTGNPNCGQTLTGFDLMGTYNGNEYYVSQFMDHWEDCQAIAAQFDAKLATISDEAENDFIYQNIPSSAFIGLNDEDNEGTFVWDDGSPITYLNYANSTQNTGNRDYVKIQASNGEWKIHGPNFQRRCVMELECVNGGAGISYDQTTGPANGSDLSEGTYIITYQVTDACGNLETCSFEITVTQQQSTDYCESEADRPWHEYIGFVNFNTIFNVSGKDGYGDFTDVSTIVDRGNTYNFILTPEFSWDYWDQYVRVWIDFNQDSDFDDPGELVLETISEAGTPAYPPTAVDVINSSITIPEGAIPGTTRMRISMQRESYAEPCEFFVFGEVEDYSIVINSTTNFAGSSDLFYFNALKSDRSVNLQWATNSENRTDYFIVEHSTNGDHFEELLYVASTDDSESERQYLKVDENPAHGDNFYRLKQVFTDGSYRYSNVDKVNFDLDVHTFEVFPVPANGVVFVNLKSFSEEKGKLSIYNSFGGMVFQQAVAVSDELLEIDLGQQASGVYMLVVELEGRKKMFRKIVLVE